MVWRWPWATEEWSWRLRDNALKIGKSGEPWYKCNWMSFTRPFLLGSVFFRTALPCSGGYHRKRGGMPLHDAVWINCKKGALLKSKVQMLSIYVYGLRMYVDYCVCVIWLDVTILLDPWWREKVMVYYILLFFFFRGACMQFKWRSSGSFFIIYIIITFNNYLMLK